jgi:hypothetical protein
MGSLLSSASLVSFLLSKTDGSRSLEVINIGRGASNHGTLRRRIKDNVRKWMAWLLDLGVFCGALLEPAGRWRATYQEEEALSRSLDTQSSV